MGWIKKGRKRGEGEREEGKGARKGRVKERSEEEEGERGEKKK